MKSWNPSIGIGLAALAGQNMGGAVGADVGHRVWHDGGEASLMQTSPIREFTVRGDNALGLGGCRKPHGAVCARATAMIRRMLCEVGSQGR